jgi:DNA replication protein DnaC
LKAARLDNSVETEMRALARVEVLILDDFALQSMDPTETSDFYELIVERHQKTSTIVTSNRDPSEWIAVMSDPLLAQSARRPARLHQLRTRHRRRVLPPPATTPSPRNHKTH